MFSRLKHKLGTEAQSRSVQGRDAPHSMSMLLEALNASIHAVVVSEPWRSAFWDAGLTGVQAALADSVLEKVSMTCRPVVDGNLPSLADLESIFPQNTVLPIDAMFSFFLHTPRADAEIPGAAGVRTAPDELHVSSPWLGRLRSSSSVVGTSAPSQQAAASWPKEHPVPPPKSPPPTTLPGPAVPWGRRFCRGGDG